MKPIIRIKTEDKDLSAAIGSRLISLAIKDEAGIKSDSLTLILSDEPAIAFPAEGQLLEVAIGFREDIFDMGSFATKHIALSGWPRILKIEAIPLQKHLSLKSQREQSWHNILLGEIATAIARRHGLRPAIAKRLSTIRISHEDQTESDIAFLTRLGRRFDATVKVASGHLILSESNRAMRVSGLQLPMVEISNPISFEYAGDQSMAYTGVRAFWYDSKTARKNHLLVGKEGTVFNLEYNKGSEENARRAAESKLRSIARRGRTLSLTVVGNPEISAERICLVKGIRKEIDGEWIIKSVEHKVDGSGFLSRLECEVAGFKESET